MRAILTGWGLADFVCALQRVERLYSGFPVYAYFDGSYFRIVVFHLEDYVEEDI